MISIGTVQFASAWVLVLLLLLPIWWLIRRRRKPAAIVFSRVGVLAAVCLRERIDRSRQRRLSEDQRADHEFKPTAVVS